MDRLWYVNNCTKDTRGILKAKAPKGLWESNGSVSPRNHISHTYLDWDDYGQPRSSRQVEISLRFMLSICRTCPTIEILKGGLLAIEVAERRHMTGIRPSIPSSIANDDQ